MPTPRIFRIPNKTGDSNILTDRYVAVMGGGMGSTFVCAGSNVFIVDLENDGRIFGYKENDGPINIVDLEGNEIDNAIKIISKVCNDFK